MPATADTMGCQGQTSQGRSQILAAHKSCVSGAEGVFLSSGIQNLAGFILRMPFLRCGLPTASHCCISLFPIATHSQSSLAPSICQRGSERGKVLVLHCNGAKCPGSRECRTATSWTVWETGPALSLAVPSSLCSRRT